MMYLHVASIDTYTVIYKHVLNFLQKKSSESRCRSCLATAQPLKIRRYITTSLTLHLPNSHPRRRDDKNNHIQKYTYGCTVETNTHARVDLRKGHPRVSVSSFSLSSKLASFHLRWRRLKTSFALRILCAPQSTRVTFHSCQPGKTKYGSSMQGTHATLNRKDPPLPCSPKACGRRRRFPSADSQAKDKRNFFH